MSTTICLSANTLYYSEGAGHMWVFLNWGLGLKANGCRVIWLEKIKNNLSIPTEEVSEKVKLLNQKLKKFGFENALALYPWNDEELSTELTEQTVSLEEAGQSDLLLNLQYGIPEHVMKFFRRSALVDIDPGLLQFFLAKGKIELPKHDVYFTIGETVGLPTAKFPSAGIDWLYTPPCVAIDYWLPTSSSDSAPFTTLSHWNTDQWIVEEDGSYYSNDKRDGFLPYLDLPNKTSQKLELALCLGKDTKERDFLTQKGWRIKDSADVSATPQQYMEYIQSSRGEFSCVKPHCVKLENAWISDRTLCYLASGKPSVVEHTGPSRILPDCSGLFRFKNLNEAVRCLEEVSINYEKHSKLARGLAEEYFDASVITKRVLEKAL